jgi:hypothetical protein
LMNAGNRPGALSGQVVVALGSLATTTSSQKTRIDVVVSSAPRTTTLKLPKELPNVEEGTLANILHVVFHSIPVPAYGKT